MDVLVRSTHLIDNTRPSVHVRIGSHGCITEQFLWWLIAPCSCQRRVRVVHQLAHKAVDTRIRDANAAIVLDQNVALHKSQPARKGYSLDKRTNWTDVPMFDTLPVQITDSLRNLGDLKQFVRIGVTPVVINDISLCVVRDLEFRR